MWRNGTCKHSEQKILGRRLRSPPFWHSSFEILPIPQFYDSNNYELRKISLKIRLIKKGCTRDEVAQDQEEKLKISSCPDKNGN